MDFIENYKEIKNIKPTGIRGRMRGLALNGLCILDKIEGAEQHLNKPRVQFLYIHHVFKDEENKLNYLMKRLALNHTFISYSEGIKRILTREIDRPYICNQLRRRI